MQLIFRDFLKQRILFTDPLIVPSQIDIEDIVTSCEQNPFLFITPDGLILRKSLIYVKRFRDRIYRDLCQS